MFARYMGVGMPQVDGFSCIFDVGAFLDSVFGPIRTHLDVLLLDALYIYLDLTPPCHKKRNAALCERGSGVDTNTFINEGAMARHGLILSQDEATPFEATPFTNILETPLACFKRFPEPKIDQTQRSNYRQKLCRLAKLGQFMGSLKA